MTKLKLSEKIASLYAPSARGVDTVDVPEFNFIMIDGKIEHGKSLRTSKSFQNALNMLNGISFTLKFMSKLDRENPIDYNTMPLEALWHNEGEKIQKIRSEWDWTLMVMQPKHITAEMFNKAVESLRRKQGDIPALQLARLESFHEGLAMQIMHVSTPGLIPMTIERIKDFARDQGCKFRGLYHEVYLSDPRHTNPEKERTILRFPVKKEA